MKLALLAFTSLSLTTTHVIAQNPAALSNAPTLPQASVAKEFLDSLLTRNTYTEKASSVRAKIERFCKEDPSSPPTGFSSDPLTAHYKCATETHVKALGITEGGTGPKKQVVFFGVQLSLADFELVQELMVKNFGKKYLVEEYKKSPEFKNRPELHGITAYTWSLGRDKRVLHGFNLYPSLEKDVLRGTVTVELREDAVSGD